MSEQMIFALIGIALTTSALMFVLIAVVDGIKDAIWVMGFTWLSVAVLAAISAFWLWVAVA